MRWLPRVHPDRRLRPDAVRTLKVNRLLLRNAGALGVAWGAFLENNLMRTAGARPHEMLDAGFLHPQIGARYKFEYLPVALESLQRGPIPGKGVVELIPEE